MGGMQEAGLITGGEKSWVKDSNEEGYGLHKVEASMNEAGVY